MEEEEELLEIEELDLGGLSDSDVIIEEEIDVMFDELENIQLSPIDYIANKPTIGKIIVQA